MADQHNTEETNLDGGGSGASAGCPVDHTAKFPVENGNTNEGWWPHRLNLSILRKHPAEANPLGGDFDYTKQVQGLDFEGLKRDVVEVMHTSQDWWPADFGHYGPFFIRMSWHAAGTYRVEDGRGGAGAGMQRFAPLNSWPDNGNLDKARRLLWPVKQKYGQQVSWADLIVLAGTVALEDMGLPVFGFAFGRPDVWEPDEDVYWGPEHTWLADERYSGDRDLEKPLAAVQMGLIYVNPEGPNGEPDPLAAARDIRETFKRMAMNDEETVALIAGGHTLGKTHGAADPDEYVGAEPEGASLQSMGLGWHSTFGSGKGRDAITSGPEVTWSQTPTRWSMAFFDNLFGHEYELVKSPAGAWQWEAKDAAADIPDPEDGTPSRKPTMLTTDMSLRMDPVYEEISRRFHADPEAFADAYARAWFKLTHRDMGPIQRYLGPWVPQERLLWQDPVPPVEHELVGDDEVAELKEKVLASGLGVPELVATAWASASTFRGGDKRGGANGARIRLEPQNGWEVNDPDRLAGVLRTLEGVREDFNGGRSDGKAISLADLIVLAGTAAVEKAASDGGHPVEVGFTPGRTDASQEDTDVEQFDYLEPRADGFRNFYGKENRLPAEYLLVDRSNLLGVTAPEMTVLVGGLRVLGANAGDSEAGVLTDRVGVLSNDFFRNLLGMEHTWHSTSDDESTFEARDASGAARWTGTRADLVFGSNSELRALAEVYASDDAAARFAADFAAAWTKVMDADRYDVR